MRLKRPRDGAKAPGIIRPRKLEAFSIESWKWIRKVGNGTTEKIYCISGELRVDPVLNGSQLKIENGIEQAKENKPTTIVVG